ncbi:hypothetical protein F5J12DRAFT_785817 [Pisolithus orientalis]|uniref:uncharacterized protein n=1 Tax=Pisolithus orientalis TaxID=936130 RepID=UPI0022255EFE|nr:uncharacterized protein F5J12DRAFT_785817 [Pisolithus orientalis]KAI5994254.1 hypothetical protein F5J12DRAFT_785817 [Pisolithus orientalis]
MLIMITSEAIMVVFVSSHSWYPPAGKYLPVVPTLLLYTSTAIQCILDSGGFLQNCHQQLIVISSPNSINAILQGQHSVFKGDSMQIKLIKEISGLQENVLPLQEILQHQIAP